MDLPLRLKIKHERPLRQRMRHIGLIVEQVIDPGAKFELLAELPGHASVDREVPGLETISISADQSEQVGVGTRCIAPANRRFDRLSHAIPDVAVGTPFRDAGELNPFGGGICCVLHRLGIDPGQVRVDIKALNQDVLGFDHQLGAVLPDLIYILVAGDDCAELIKTAEAEDGILDVLVEQAECRLNLSGTVTQDEVCILRAFSLQIRVEALRIDGLRYVIKATLVEFANRWKALGRSKTDLDRQCIA